MAIEPSLSSAGECPKNRMSLLDYAELDNSLNQIRLIVLHPGDSDEEIQLTLRNVSLFIPNIVPSKRLTTNELQKTLPPGWVTEETAQYRYRYIFEDADENTSWTHPNPRCDPAAWQDLEELPPLGFEPEFEALSYNWGSQQDQVTARVVSVSGDGGEYNISITRNLSAALRALRYPDRTRTLWVDAICIDQSNHQERSSQVRHMSLIYKLAQRVIIWLGPSTQSTVLAVETLHHLGSQLEVSRRQARYRAPNAEEPEWFRATTSSPYDNGKWQAIIEFLQYPWFERLWIWQEVQHANSYAMVVCGSYCLDWQCLRKALICLYTKDELPYPGLRQRFEIVEPLMYERHGSSAYLMLSISRQRFCTEPKDHIYGMLSICGPKLASKIKPNYDPDVPYRDIYKDVFLKYMNQVQRLDLLSECEQASSEHGGPSWIPDWSVKRNTYPLYGFTFASGVSASVAAQCYPDVLQVKGIQAAVLCSVSKSTPINSSDIMSSWREREPLDLCTETYPTGESLLSAYCSTLRAGFLAERWPDHAGPSLEEWKAQYLSTMSSFSRSSPGSQKVMDNADVAWCLRIVRARPVFRTTNGYVGLGPPGTEIGDIVTIFLGCKAPMVLRPFFKGSRHGYTIVGECYVHGLDDTVTLLGNLSSNFRIQLGKERRGYAATHTYKNLETKETMKEDPRLPPLPPGWCRMDRDKTSDDPALFQLYRNTETGEELNYDPRLSADALESLGIQLQDFDLY